MADESQVSRNPANSGSLTGVFKEVLGKHLARVDDMLPAVIVSFDRTTNRASVRPIIQLLKTDRTTLSRAVIDDVPVLAMGGSGFVLSFNFMPGDLGWLKANDRDISLFLQDVEKSPPDSAPNTIRQHSFADAMFIPDQFDKAVIAAEDQNAMMLQNFDGSTKIAIRNTGIEMVGDAGVGITATTGQIVHVSGLSTFSNDVFVGVNFSVFGTIAAFTNITSIVGDIIATAGDIKAGTGAAERTLKTHTHTYDPTLTTTPQETSTAN